MNDKRTQTWALYEQRLRRVSDYIHAHIDEAIDNDRLAEIACLSSYHWHRIYRAVHGETTAQTVKRLRLHRAAGDLASSGLAVAEIARRCGYPNVQSFNRIFKSVYGLPPGLYRKRGSHAIFDPILSQRNQGMFDVTIRRFPAQSLVTLAHRGSYMSIGKAFEQLIGILCARQQFNPEGRMVGLYLDDPEAVAERDLRSYAGLTEPTTSEIAPPLEAVVLEAGECAVLRHKGPYADMRFAYRWLYGEWLRTSGREVADRPVFEIYVNNPREVAPTELLTEICLPLR